MWGGTFKSSSRELSGGRADELSGRRTIGARMQIEATRYRLSLEEAIRPLSEQRERPASGLHLLVTGDKLAQTVPLPQQGEVVIGRAGADVAIAHASISRRHAIIRLGPALTIEDLGSLNGTTLNGARLKPGKRFPLQAGNLVRVGDVVLVIQRVRQDEATLAQETSVKLLSPRHKASTIVVESEAMRRLYETVDRVASSTISVLLLGETGVGKQVVAEALHARSSRATRPFISLSCVAFPESLLEAEIFGYEKGAFTGAERAKPGLLENAEGGTVFLDEIGEIPPSVQAKLLRVIEERQVLRLGALKPILIDVRFVTATNRELSTEVLAGRFRQDLYFRLNGIGLRVPPLRERVTEIEPLARHFLKTFCQQLGKATLPEIGPEALVHLTRHAWPGNVRELRNVIERAILLSGDGPIRPEHLALETSGSPTSAPGTTAPGESTERLQLGTIREELGALERERVLAALESCHGNQTRAAKFLGMSRSAFVSKLDLYGVPRPRKGQT
jgi:two-component system response regulator AtoC